MFRNGNKIKISDTLFRKVRRAAEMVGCPVEEFIEQALQREAELTISLTRKKLEPPTDLEEAANQ
jgi:hypothetical protein